MPAIRHVLRDNTWHMQCPRCFEFVRVARAEFEGDAPFPAHRRWHPSWVNREADRHGWLFAYPRLIRVIVWAELLVRKVTARWEPLCDYRETVNWRDEHGWPVTGMTTFGPIE
jgi:hypothetical protein